MDILHYSPDILTPLTQFYNRLIADVLHCYPVQEEEFADVISGVFTGKEDKKQGELELETAFVAIIDGAVKAFIHVLLSSIGKNKEENIGLIRFLGYERGERHAGQAVLEKAEVYLKAFNITQILVFRSGFEYRFYHLEYANLSDALDQVQALLGFNGYQRLPGEVFLDWENYTVTPTPSSLPVTLSVNWEQGRGLRPNCNVRGIRDGKEVGECDSVSGGSFSSHPDAQGWLHTVWLGIEDEFQGQGLGRYLLQHALQEMHKVGYRHAAISSGLDNHRAFLFYNNCGYRTVDWTYQYDKVLPGTPKQK